MRVKALIFAALCIFIAPLGAALHGQGQAVRVGSGDARPVEVISDGAARLTVLPSGRVGVGTRAPAQTLDVVGTSPGVRVRSSESSGIGYIQFGGNSTATNNWYHGSDGAGSYHFYNGVVGSASLALSLNTSTGTVNYGTFTVNNAANTSYRFVVTDAGLARIFSLEGAGNRAVYSDANGILTNSASDGRLKTNVAPITGALDTVQRLQGVSFNWIDTVKRGEQREIGLIAQEVAPVVPEVVGRNADGTLSVDYPKLTALLIEAVKELSQKVAALEAK